MVERRQGEKDDDTAHLMLQVHRKMRGYGSFAWIVGLFLVYFVLQTITEESWTFSSASTRMEKQKGTTMSNVGTDGPSFATAFSSDMVLQRGPKSPVVYGSYSSLTNPDFAVRVQDEATGLSYHVSPEKAFQPGTWRATLRPGPTNGGGSFSIAVVENGQILHVLERVTFGDVWFCAGQSNMALALPFTFSWEKLSREIGQESLWWDRKLRFLDYAGMDDLGKAKTYPNYVSQDIPASTKWLNISTGQSTKKLTRFSSTCFYFGVQMINRMRKVSNPVPIGLIHAAIGGTQIESWAPISEINACSDTNITAKQRAAPASLYNGLVAPFVNTTITGTIWYQGENNVYGFPGLMPSGSSGYSCMFTRMISFWRSNWSAFPHTTAPDSPFGFVSLAAETSEGNPTHMGQFRAAQLKSQSELKNIFVAHAYDLGDPWPNGACAKAGCCPPKDNAGQPFTPAPNCLNLEQWMKQDLDGDWTRTYVNPLFGPIHPRNKRRIGDRLAVAALALQSNRKLPNPRLSSCEVGSSQASLRFESGEDFLLVIPKEKRTILSRPFEVCAGDFLACSCRMWDYDYDHKQWLCTDGRHGRPGIPARWSNYSNKYSRVPPHNPYSDFWMPVQDYFVEDRNSRSLSLSNWTSTAGKSLGPILAIRYAWEESPCCDGQELAKGLEPCPPMNCAVFSESNQLPPDPFHVEVDSLGQCII